MFVLVETDLCCVNNVHCDEFNGSARMNEVMSLNLLCKRVLVLNTDVE